METKHNLRIFSVNIIHIICVLVALILSILLPFGTQTANAQGYIYVTKSGSPSPYGSASSPYHMVEAGIVRTLSSHARTVRIEAGKYYETFTTDIPCTLEAIGGTVTIGELDYQASTTLDIITLNTHLAGDQAFMPSWQDDARTCDIALFFGGTNPRPDVVGFQEIWDEDLFFEIILPMSGYFPFGQHGDRGLTNSGLALMSQHAMDDFYQVSYDVCSGSDCYANKGWIQATIKKDGFHIRLFNTHTQAGDEEVIRAAQIIQLGITIHEYRASHPDHVVFAIGDFNVYGDAWEYNKYFIPIIGDNIGGMDADRNSPGFYIGDWFIFGISDSWTYSEYNPLTIYFDDEAVSGRLDYIFYFPSLDGSIEVIPTDVTVLPFRGRTLSEDGLTTNESSDHWSVYGQFKLIRK